MLPEFRLPLPDAKPPVQQPVDLTFQLISVRQIPEQSPFYLFPVFQIHTDVIHQKLFPLSAVNPARQAGIDFPDTPHPLSGRRRILFLLLPVALFLARKGERLLIGLPQPPEPLRIVLRIIPGQPCAVSAFYFILIFRLRNSQYRKYHIFFHNVPSMCPLYPL